MSESGGGLGKLLIPIVILACIGAGAYFFLNKEKGETTNGGGDIGKAAAGAMEGMTEDAKKMAGDVKDAVANAVPDIAALKTDLSGFMDSLTGELGKITDASSAELALPGLKESVAKIESLAKSLGILPADAKAPFVEMIKGQLEKINPVLEKITAIPGIGDAVKQVIDQIKQKLVGLVG